MGQQVALSRLAWGPVSTPAAPEIPGLEHVRLLGSGGFADVHLYRQELPRMVVAVKVLRAATGAIGDIRDIRDELVAEANTMAEHLDRRMDFTEDGRLTVSYDQARPKGAGQGWAFDGRVVDDVTTSDGSMSFDLVEDDLSLTVDGVPTDTSPGVGSVSYTCAGDTMTQTSSGLDATYRRTTSG